MVKKIGYLKTMIALSPGFDARDWSFFRDSIDLRFEVQVGSTLPQR